MTAAFGTNCELGDVVEFVNGGAWSQSAYSESGVPVVRVTDIRGDHIDLSECKYLPFELLQKYSNHLLRTGDLVIATVGSHPTQPNSVVGRPAVVSDKIDGCLLNQNAVLLRSKSSSVDQRWLGYLGRSPRFRSYIVECARGSANQVRMSIGLLKKMPVEVPSLEAQRRAASILRAYDELIEVNRRRIALLEKMAQGLFEERFVHFRFPGHEQFAMTETKPNDWRLVKVGSVLKKFRRPMKVMKQEYEQGGIIPCIDQGADFIGGYTNNTDALITSPLPLCVFGDHTRVLKFIRFPFASGADGTQLLYPVDDLTPEFLYFSLLNIDLSNQHYARHFKFLKEQEIWLPTRELIERFTMVVKPQMELVENLRFQNQKLAASRDLLIPRLISGELSVTQAERELEEAA